MASATIEGALAHAKKTLQDALADSDDSSKKLKTATEAISPMTDAEAWASRMTPSLETDDWAELCKLLHKQQRPKTTANIEEMSLQLSGDHSKVAKLVDELMDLFVSNYDDS